MVGDLLQILCLIFSLLTTWLLSKKKYEKYGYLIGFVTLPVWCITEAFYHQWYYLAINPLYFYLWGLGLKNHWSKT
jgi:hypothetical protein